MTTNEYLWLKYTGVYSQYTGNRVWNMKEIGLVSSNLKWQIVMFVFLEYLNNLQH